MTNFIEQPVAVGLVKLSGRITNYNRRRGEASFVLTSTDQSAMGIVAIAAALTGLGGQAISTAGSAGSLEEEADYVQFFINGERVQGWVWRSPFKEGDVVEVAAEWQGDHYEAFGIARPIDKIVALYPHCSRGRLAHVRNVFFWWFWLGCITQIVLMTALVFHFMGPPVFVEPGFYVALAGLGGFYGLMFTSLAWKWRPFVAIAEKVFRTLGWSNPSYVDLVKSSKAQRTTKDPGEFGTFYFRY